MATALITGASSGIGEVFAWELAQRNYDLVLVARSEAKLQELAEKLMQAYAIHAEIIVQDLSNPGAGTTVFEAVSQKGWTVDMLINNAGFGDYGSFSDRPLPKIMEMIQLNIATLVELTHLFLTPMRQRRSGTIINVASIAGFLPLPYMSVYAATKAFVLSFSSALWAENRADGIRIQALCPGPTSTQFFQVAEFPATMNGNGGNMVTAAEVVKESLKGLETNKSNIVTGGLKTQIIVNLQRFFPRDFLLSLMESQFKAK
ncbi:MAG TPA: SDR family oxidoreductase [Oscillatoriaceae cyanobacterium M33_DOE_052]|uniref:SDR family oxidoreductase n=1 Tax=Planktothricoides sp. SpSt-374 TaxID=2282167 RepID=A0A7C3ZLW0_9CYAN|nr:SDR family oxidoreductase [Oscillatoriaceae cyanobacterium M33_DOE_052]